MKSISPAPKLNASSLDPDALFEDAHWLKIKARFAKNPGAFFLRWDGHTCKQRIRRATTRDLPELRIALQKEEAKRMPRKLLVPFLRKRIAELEEEQVTRAGRSIDPVGEAVAATQTISIFIQRAASEVYSFLAVQKNLPTWATAFCSAIRSVDGKWIAETPKGPFPVRIARKNDFGIVDHHVELGPDQEIHIPIRVLKNGDGAEVLFTIFRPANMRDERYTTEVEMVERDLDTLKRLLEQQ
ncbi:hypothetical protein ACXR0O_12485 [Verrucomicrobiota bacterium sgz303538]